MSIFNIFGKKPDRVSQLKEQIAKSQNADIKALSKINKSFRILIDEGEIELVIKNINGVIKETKK